MSILQNDASRFTSRSFAIYLQSAVFPLVEKALHPSRSKLFIPTTFVLLLHPQAYLAMMVVIVAQKVHNFVRLHIVLHKTAI